MVQSYRENLKDPRWQRKRLEIFKRDKWRCQLCHNTTDTLTVHHLKYLPNKEPWEYPNDFFVTYCEPCHLQERDRAEVIAQLLKNIETFPTFPLDILSYALGTMESMGIFEKFKWVISAFTLAGDSKITRKFFEDFEASMRPWEELLALYISEYRNAKG